MKTICSLALGLTAVFCLALVARADDAKKADAPKEVTLKGTITCAKCDLKLEDAKKCATVITVKGDKAGDKDVIYYLDEKSGKDNHGTICKGAKAGSVTGTVMEKDGKKIITATDVKFDK